MAAVAKEVSRTPITDAALALAGEGFKTLGQTVEQATIFHVAITARKLETDRAALIAALATLGAQIRRDEYALPIDLLEYLDATLAAVSA